MIKIKGKAVTEGAASGRIAFSGKRPRVVRRYHVQDTKAETARFEAAAKKVLSRLRQGTDREKEYGLILSDPDFYNSVTGTISSQKVNAEFAAALSGNSLFDLFTGSDDGYMQAQAEKILAAADFIIDELLGRTGNSDDVIICTGDPENEITESGGVKAVVSSSDKLKADGNLPAISCAEDLFKYDIEGKYAVADGFAGILYIEPDKATEAEISERSRQLGKRRELAERLKNCESISLDGRRLQLCAEINEPSELASAYKNRADGIGLFRTDRMYTGSSLPSEDYMFSFCKAALEKAAGKELTFCTFDLSADCTPDCLGIKKEQNPALGFRSTRIALARREILKTQLRALCRASFYGKLSLAVPMLTNVGEFTAVKELLEEIKKELRFERLLFNEDIRLGAMIETPAAALTSSSFAKAADFLLINTDRLSELTLAADMNDPQLKELFAPARPAVLRLVSDTVKAAGEHGKFAVISGRLAEDTELAEFFLAVGAYALTVRAGHILPLKDRIRSTSVRDREQEIINRYTTV